MVLIPEVGVEEHHNPVEAYRNLHFHPIVLVEVGHPYQVAEVACSTHHVHPNDVYRSCLAEGVVARVHPKNCRIHQEAVVEPTSDPLEAWVV